MLNPLRSTVGSNSFETFPNVVFGKRLRLRQFMILIGCEDRRNKLLPKQFDSSMFIGAKAVWGAVSVSPQFQRIRARWFPASGLNFV